jgi:hypothetical protein
MLLVDDIFEPVTWHDQMRLFFPVLACKTGKTRRGLAGGASSDDQVSPVFMTGLMNVGGFLRPRLMSGD